MMETLLQIQSLVPITGIVVLAGAFSFFWGIFLGRGTSNQAVVDGRLVPQLEDQIHRIASERSQQMQLAEQQSKQLRLMRNMLELRAIIDAGTDEPLEALERFAAALRTSIDADRVALYFVARRTGERLQPIVQCGNPTSIRNEATWTLHEQELATLAIDSELPRFYDAESLRDRLGDCQFRSAAIMPLRVNGRVLGTLCLTGQSEWEALGQDRKLIEYAIETLSQTLRRAFDEATIRRQARHDHLTDLVNRRSFDAYLTTEIERIQLGDSAACSLILADLDRFKTYNDRFGHQGGDQVLRATARVLTEQVSKMRLGEHSIVARYGGEEFAILLPNVGLPAALRIAEGIRAAIEAEVIRIQNVSTNVTISLGVATYAGEIASAESLIATADKFLYQAKSEGRNRVCHPSVDLESNPIPEVRQTHNKSRAISQG